MDRALNDPVVDCCGRDVADCDCPKYVATINVPGYLPMDDDPPVFDTAREAWSYLAEERERGEDDYEGEDYSDTVNLLRRISSRENWYGGRIDPNICHMYAIDPTGEGSVWGSTPGYDGTHDLGLAYCVSVAE